MNNKHRKLLAIAVMTAILAMGIAPASAHQRPVNPNKGEQGVQGKQGKRGHKGTTGIAGTNGTSGAAGMNGTNGTAGINGLAGLPVAVAKRDGTTSEVTLGKLVHTNQWGMKYTIGERQ